MSARVCYLKRGWRGGSIASVQLVSLTGEERLGPEPSRTEGGTQSTLPGEIAPESAAKFVQETLAGVRGPAELALLCLDAEGAAASWVASPTHDRGAIASLVRMGQHGSSADGEGSRLRASPLEQIGQDPYGASIEPLVAQDGEAAGTGLLGRARRDRTPQGPRSNERVGVLSMVDAPARVLIDELDRRGVVVEGVASVWHAMAQALDPTPQGEDGLRAPVVAIVTAEVDGRVLWAWSRGRELLAAGAIRAVAHANSEGEAGVALGDAEAARIINDWLAWGAQLCVAPARVIAVLPEGDDMGQSSRGFALRLGSLWQDATVDATVAPDPMAMVLRRLVERIEGTPTTRTIEEVKPTTRLVGLSTRPGTGHRSMVRWGAGAVLAAALVCVVLGLRLRGAAEKATGAAAEWNNKWHDPVQAEYPAALVPQPGKSARAILQEEVDRQRKRMTPPPPIEPAYPIMQELATVSMVLSNANVAVETIDVDTRAQTVRVVVQCPDIAYAERLMLALGQIDGSWVTNWTATNYVNTPAPPGGTAPERPLKATLSARWTEEAKTWAEQVETGRAAPAGGGGA